MGQEGAGQRVGATLRGKGGALTLLVRAPLQLTDESSVFSLHRLGSESINTIQCTPETQYRGSRLAADDDGGEDGDGGGDDVW